MDALDALEGGSLVLGTGEDHVLDGLGGVVSGGGVVAVVGSVVASGGCVLLDSTFLGAFAVDVEFKRLA